MITMKAASRTTGMRISINMRLLLHNQRGVEGHTGR
jgi:hypothetical protein